jgi:tetraprenyl-beta-curcumene synthase
MMSGFKRCQAALVLARAAEAYWLEIFPRLCGETRYWRRRAASIPNPTLRVLALEAQRDKRGNLEGSVAFAISSPRRYRATALRAMLCYQMAFDYLDYLCEQPNAEPIANGRRLTSALISAIARPAGCIDYYAHNAHKDDNGYLQQLVGACSISASSLPAYTTVASGMFRASKGIVAYQSLHHGDARGSRAPFNQWAKEETERYDAERPAEPLRWWELAAAAGSSLVVLALLAAGADRETHVEAASAIERAYFPWIGAANSLLDSLVDQEEDHAHGLVSYYASPNDAALRIELVLTQAVRHAQSIAPPEHHLMILTAMVNFYLTAPEARRPELRDTRQRLRTAPSELGRPIMLIMRSRSAARHAAEVYRALKTSSRFMTTRFKSIGF